MKEVNCHYTFGVYTHWDRCIEAKKKDMHSIRGKFKKQYLKMREAHDEVFFVNVESVEKIKVGLLREILYSLFIIRLSYRS